MGAKGIIKQESPKIVESNITNYRAFEALNCSSVKTFDKEGQMAFFNQFILGQEKKKRRTITKDDGFLIGSLSDFLVLDCLGDEEVFNQTMDEHFCIDSTVGSMSQAIVLADKIFEIYKKDEDSYSFPVAFSEAFAYLQSIGKYSGKTDVWALDDFEKKAFSYLKSKIENVGKEAVSEWMINKSKNVAATVMGDEFTAWVFKEEPDVEKYLKFPIEWVWETVLGDRIRCKSELDIFFVNHRKKEVYIKDLKCVYDNETFEYMYVKNQYYLQNAFYYKAVAHWLKENNMNDYIIMGGMDFVVADTSMNNRRPLIYKTSYGHVMEGLEGFGIDGRWYNGLNKLVEDINWHIKSDVWNCGKDAFENNGVVCLKTFNK